MKKTIILLILGLSGCNYTALHDPLPLPSEGEAEQCVPTGNLESSITYLQIRDEVLAPKCVSCHSSSFSAGGVNLDNYASAKIHASRILFTVENNQMPRGPNGPLLPAEKEKVFLWVTSGAPENLPTMGCDETLPPTPPLDEEIDETGPISIMPNDSEINFSLVKNRIFQLHCIGCHSQASPASGLNLENYRSVESEIDDLDEEIAESSMPPPPRPNLSAIERSVIKRWIQLGLPE